MNYAWIKKVYLYTVSLVSLVIMVVAAIMLVNLALKTWVFPDADKNIMYAPTLNCGEVKNPNSTLMPMDPNCSDPNFAQKQHDEESKRQKAQKEQDAAMAISMLVVAAPVFFYHWKLARKES